MARYKIKNWQEYQHYKDRCPPWIKLHHSLLTSETWVMCNDASRSLAIACMFLASRNSDMDGSFNGDPEYIMRFGYLNSKPNFKQLIDYEFIELLQDASIPIAECDTEKRREEKRQSREEGEKEAAQSVFILPDWIDKDQWDLWMKTRPGKKMIPEQMQAQVDKLSKWRDAGLDHCKALADSASAGWRGLFEPKIPIARGDKNSGRDLAKEKAEFCGTGNNENVIEGEFNRA